MSNSQTSTDHNNDELTTLVSISACAFLGEDVDDEALHNLASFMALLTKIDKECNEDGNRDAGHGSKH